MSWLLGLYFCVLTRTVRGRSRWLCFPLLVVLGCSLSSPPHSSLSRFLDVPESADMGQQSGKFFHRFPEDGLDLFLTLDSWEKMLFQSFATPGSTC